MLVVVFWFCFVFVSCVRAKLRERVRERCLLNAGGKNGKKSSSDSSGGLCPDLFFTDRRVGFKVSLYLSVLYAWVFKIIFRSACYTRGF